MSWQLVYTKQSQKDAKKLAASGLKNKAQKNSVVGTEYSANRLTINVRKIIAREISIELNLLLKFN